MTALALLVWIGLPAGCAVYAGAWPSIWVVALGTALVGLMLRRRYRNWRRAPFTYAAEMWAEQEKLRHQQSLQQQSATLLTLSPQAFEDAVAAMYRALGYQVIQTPYAADGGWDLELHRAGDRILVECKQWDPTRPVGRPVLQVLHSAMVTEGATKGIMVTTARFTTPAREFAHAYNIQLVDGDYLARLMVDAYPNADDPNVMFGLCPNCGRLAGFPATNGSLGALLQVPLSLCPNGHAVGHPAFISLHPAVNEEAKRRYLATNPHASVELAARARLQELALLRESDAALVRKGVGTTYITRTEAEQVAATVNQAHRRVVAYDAESAELRQMLSSPVPCPQSATPWGNSDREGHGES